VLDAVTALDTIHEVGLGNVFKIVVDFEMKVRDILGQG